MHPGQLRLSSADYDLNVAAKARTAIVINITALAGMPVRNSLIHLSPLHFPTAEEPPQPGETSACPKNDA
jgi:hypothetical protein